MSYFEDDEPRTNADIIRDLVDLLQPRVWRVRYERCSKGCCGEYVNKCSCCGAVADDPDPLEPQEAEPEHKEWCRLGRILREAEAFLRAEEGVKS